MKNATITAFLAFFGAAGVIFFCSIKPVVAQSPTETATWEPLYSSPTPVPTQNYACPQTTPIGWGTYTPNPSWNMNCANCMLTLTPAVRTPEPTMMWETPGTPHATSSVPTQTTATPTQGTPAPTATTEPYVDWAIDYDYYKIGNTTTHMEHVDQKELTEQHAGEDSVYGVPLVMQFAVGCMPGKTCTGTKTFNTPYYMYCSAVATRNTPGTIGVQIKFYDHAGAIAGSGCSRECTNSTYCNIDCSVTGNYGPHAFAQTERVIQAQTSDYGGVSMGESWAAQCVLMAAVQNWLPTPTPAMTPTAEPTGTATPGYCGDLGQGGGNDTDPNLLLPVIRKGAATCAGWSEFVIDLTDFPFISDLGVITLPGLNICMQPITFGEVGMFGITISLDLMASIMAGIMAIRIFTRSI